MLWTLAGEHQDEYEHGGTIYVAYMNVRANDDVYAICRCSVSIGDTMPHCEIGVNLNSV